MSVIYKNNLANIYREIVVVLYNNKCVDADKSSQPKSEMQHCGKEVENNFKNCNLKGKELVYGANYSI